MTINPRATKLRRFAALEAENAEPIAPASGTFYRRVLTATLTGIERMPT